MPQNDVGPGSVVADRFRLEDLLEETSGARFWRARDLTLSRDVAVHVVAADDPRAPALLTAARTSALVTDARILRVLDAVEQDDLVFVVHEYGFGMSLDRIILEEGVLDPRRAVWLVREVAEAIVAGHGTGVAHGRLVPENVMVTEAGSVKLIGLVVSGVLHGRPETAPDGSPPPSEHESDVTNLGALLYACLVGKWPGYPDSVVPAAPRDHGRLLRPRQVKAGVPKALDTLCGQILAGPSRGRVLQRTEDPRFESATEVVEALSRWLGDGAGSVVTPGTAFAGPAAYVDPARAPGPPSPVSLGSFDGDSDVPDPEATQASPLARPDSRRSLSAPDPEPQPRLEPATPASGWATGAADADATVAAPLTAPVADRAGPTDEPRRTGPPTPPPGAVRWGPDALRGPDRDPSPARGDKPGSVWLRLAFLVAVLAVVVVGVLVILGLGSAREGDRAQPGGDDATPARSGGQVVKVVGVRDLDPPSQGGNGEEHPEQTGNVTDGDPATAWETQSYDQGPRLLIKRGVGLVLDLGSEQEVSSMRATLGGQGYAFDVFAAPEGSRSPTDITGLDRVAREQGAGGATDVRFDPVRTRYLVLWLTSLPPDGSVFRGSVQEVVVRS